MTARAAVAVFGILLSSRIAHATDSGLFLSVGLNVGPTVIGAEASLVQGPEITEVGIGPWMGGYVDALWLPGRQTGRISVGPELGWGVVGLDLGLALSTDDATRAALQVRTILTTGLVAGYYRVATSGDSELGVLLKLPFPLDGSARRGLGDAPWVPE